MATYGDCTLELEPRLAVHQNDELRVTCYFYVGTVLTIPTAITFKLQNPALTEVSYVSGVAAEVATPSTGKYVFTIALTAALGAPGIWYVRAEGTGACQAANERSFIMEATQF